MICPFCNNVETKVLDSRISENSVRRRRECFKCTRRFTTYETADIAELTVIKKDGRKQDFDRDKLLRGLMISCEKRHIEPEKVQRIADEIESMFKRRESVEVTSKEIGRLVMTRLKKLDDLAYIRFKSVHHEFDDVNEFEKEIKVLAEKGKQKN